MQQWKGVCSGLIGWGLQGHGFEAQRYLPATLALARVSVPYLVDFARDLTKIKREIQSFIQIKFLFVTVKMYKNAVKYFFCKL